MQERKAAPQDSSVQSNSTRGGSRYCIQMEFFAWEFEIRSTRWRRHSTALYLRKQRHSMCVYWCGCAFLSYFSHMNQIPRTLSQLY